MDFGFTEEQRMIRETFEKFCKKELSKEYVAWMDENVDFPPDELWQKFVDIGLFRSAVPEEYGGESIGGMVEAMVAFELDCGFVEQSGPTHGDIGDGLANGVGGVKTACRIGQQLITVPVDKIQDIALSII